MNESSPENLQTPIWHIGVACFVACFLFVAVTAAVKLGVTAPKIDADRAAALSKALAEIHQVEDINLTYPGWVDQSRGIVRLPIDTAMALAAREWKNPEAARKDLIARAEKAAAPAPKMAPKANAYE
ncbi:MAG TPA: hypothetical protein VFV81_05510 [Verrucomicrobiae bacterium]|nr:hypothetical protein [Verrucomicrobiae bacterium]